MNSNQPSGGDTGFPAPLPPLPQEHHGPPGDPPAVAVAVEEPPGGRPRRWGLLEALPLIIFLLALSLLNLAGAGSEGTPHVNVRAVLAAQSLLYMLLVGYMYWAVSIRHREPFSAAVKWSAPQKPGRWLFAGGVLAVFVQLLAPATTKQLPIERLFDSRESAFLLAVFGILAAPLVEEVMFRGFLFGAIERSVNTRVALWSTAALFAAIHVPQLRGGIPHMLVILLVGIALSAVRARTGSVVPPFLMHLSYNTTLFTMMYLATDGFRKLDRA